MLKAIKIAKFINIKSIKKELEVSLVNKIDFDNVCLFYEVLMHFTNNKVSEFVFKNIKRWFNLLIENNKHLNLSFDSIVKILANPGLNLSSEMDVFNAADTWVKHNPECRSKFAFELIKLVRLHLLSKSDMDSISKTQSCFYKCSKSIEYIKSTLSDRNANSLSKPYKNRFYTQDNFFMTTDKQRNFNFLYKVFQLKGDNATKVVDFSEKSWRRVLKTLFFNETFYFLTKTKLISYSSLTKAWKTLRYDSFEILNINACSLIGKIYIFGGYGLHYTCRNLDFGANSNYSYCGVFNPKSYTLKKATYLSEDRIHAACAVYRGRIVVSGGSDESKTLKTVEKFDHGKNKWSKMPSMVKGRRHHASIAIRNKLYMIGGSSKNCEVFDYESNKFACMKPVHPIHRYYDVRTQYTVVGQVIKVYNSRTLAVVAFDVEKGEWTIEEDSVTGMSSLGLFVY